MTAVAEPAPTLVRGSGHDRVVAWLVVAFLALLTLEWVTLSGFSGGFIKPFHLAMAAVGVVALMKWRPGRLVAAVFERFAPVYVSYYLVIALSVAGGLAYAVPYSPRTNALRQLSYVSASVVLAAVLLQILSSRRSTRILVWAGIATVATVSLGLGVALAAQNVNPVSLVREALAKSDPDIISNQLLRDAFRTDEGLAEASANLRHKVFLAITISTFLGLALLPAIDRRRHLARAVVIGGGVAGAVLVLLSLSRSTILVLVAPALLVPLRVLVRRRAGARQAILFSASTLVLVGLAASPAAELLGARFGETGSLESRLDGAGPVFLSLARESVVTGAAKPETGSSPHNLVLDAWLSGGLIASLAAAVLLVFFAMIWWRVARGYLRGTSRWLLPVEPVWLLGIGFLPLVRAVSAGNQFHMVEWTAIAVFLAFVGANDRLCSIETAKQLPREVRQP